MRPENSVPPWYRQFWPWFVIAIPGATVVACIFMLRLAFTSADDMVVDDYYREGKAINEAFQRDQLARDLNLRAELERRDEGMYLRMDLPPGAEVLSFSLFHPFDERQDIRTVPALVEEGVWVTDPSPSMGRWYLEISGEFESAQWRLKGVHDFRDDFHLTLEP